MLGTRLHFLFFCDCICSMATFICEQRADETTLSTVKSARSTKLQLKSKRKSYISAKGALSELRIQLQISRRQMYAKVVRKKIDFFYMQRERLQRAFRSSSYRSLLVLLVFSALFLTMLSLYNANISGITSKKDLEAARTVKRTFLTSPPPYTWWFRTVFVKTTASSNRPHVEKSRVALEKGALSIADKKIWA